MTDSSQKSDDPIAMAELKELLERILISIDHASEDQRRNLLTSLRHWQKGERRKHARKGCSIPVTVGTWRVFTNHIRNISTGGVFIETTAPFTRGENLTLIFSLPDKNGPVRITGHVVWRTQEGVGVEFKQPLTKELQEVIDSL